MDNDEKEDKINRSQSLLAQLEIQTRRANELKHQLQEITNSKAYRFGLKLREMRVRWFPIGSRRETIVRLVYRGYLYLRDHGVVGFLRRVSQGHRSSEPAVVDETHPQAFVRLAQVLREQNPGAAPFPVYHVDSSERRLNLVTDSINTGYLFGGVATGIILSTLLAEEWHCRLRVITRTETAVKENYYRILELNGIPIPENVEFVYSECSDPRAEVPVGDEDVFLTTSWWTTHGVKSVINGKRIFYLLQEDEREFYPSGYDYLRCSDILKSEDVHFIVNSELLYEHFKSEKFVNITENGVWFEPAWPEALFFPEPDQAAEKKNFFFYARPNNQRNLFYLGLEVIETSVLRGILDPKEWNFYFVGSDIPKVRIDECCIPQFYQNVSWAEYAGLARKTDLGLCLMYTPHPSYPPLDLAASGAVVVTNRYGVKQSLDQYSKNILCRDLSVDDLVLGMTEGAALVMDTKRRQQNYSENAISRDWRVSFTDVIQACKGWNFNVPD
jgi:O-antigen biosynthesis protein